MTTGQLQDLVNEKARLFEQSRAATDEPTQTRLHKRITDITTMIDRDRIERLEVEEKSAMRSAEAIAYGGASTTSTGPSDQQFRDLASGLIDHLDAPAEKRVTNIVDTGTGGNAFGGYSVPTTLYQTVWEHRVLTTPILPYCTVIQTGGGETLNIPTTTTDPTATAKGENAQLDSTFPILGQLSLGAWKFGELITVSNEVLQDTAIDLTGIIGRLAGRSIGTATGAQFIGGDGTTEPQGIVLASTAGKTFAASTTATLDELKALYYSVGPMYRNSPKAAWIVSDSMALNMAMLKDGDGRYYWEPSVQAAAPDLFMGRPVLTDPHIAAPAQNAKSALFGDLSAFYIREAGPMRFEASAEFKWDYDVVVYRCIARVDSGLADASAVKHGVHA